MKKLALLFACSLALAGSVWAQDNMSPSQTQPDNTKMNQGDRSPSATTADQQKENTSDRELTRQIRKSVISDKSLSTYGHNVKIIVQNGAVTLKGPVRSDEEKQSIKAKAAAVVGADKVTDQLEVAQK